MVLLAYPRVRRGNRREKQIHNKEIKTRTKLFLETRTFWELKNLKRIILPHQNIMNIFFMVSSSVIPTEQIPMHSNKILNQETKSQNESGIYLSMSVVSQTAALW